MPSTLLNPLAHQLAHQSDDFSTLGELILHGGNARLAVGANPAMGAVGSEARQGQFFSEAIYYAHGADGRFANGLTAVAWELEDTTCNGGGFGCLAGSH